MSEGTGPLPELLQQQTIPLPLHGVNPRSIMGRAAWDQMRREIYAKHNHHCATCGRAEVKRSPAWRLEAHENFTIDYKRRRMTLLGMEPLCATCHSFIHGGLLELRLVRRQVSQERVKEILGHGVGVLSKIDGTVPIVADRLCKAARIKHGLRVAKMPPRLLWSGWVMVWDGVEYPSPYTSEKAWQIAMRNRRN